MCTSVPVNYRLSEITLREYSHYRRQALTFRQERGIAIFDRYYTKVEISFIIHVNKSIKKIKYFFR